MTWKDTLEHGSWDCEWLAYPLQGGMISRAVSFSGFFLATSPYNYYVSI